MRTYFRTLGRVFGTFDRSLVVEGSLEAPKVTVWGPGLDFSGFLMDFGTLLGVDFYEPRFFMFVVTLLQYRF